MNTNELLYERNSTHGSFIINSRVAQTLKQIRRGINPFAKMTEEQEEETLRFFREGWERMDFIHREALDFCDSKDGRIYAGQHTFDDHWDDKSGYSKLPVKFNHGK